MGMNVHAKVVTFKPLRLRKLTMLTLWPGSIIWLKHITTIGRKLAIYSKSRANGFARPHVGTRGIVSAQFHEFIAISIQQISKECLVLLHSRVDQWVHMSLVPLSRSVYCSR